MTDEPPALSEDSLFTAARRVLRNIRADEAGGGLMSRETVMAAEALARHVEVAEQRIRAEWEKRK